MGWFFRSKPEITVSRYGPPDLQSLADIHQRSFSMPWNEADIARLATGKGVVTLVAREEGSGNAPPCGFVIARKAADEAEIITIAANPANRRSGIGRALLSQAIREMQHDRIARVFLEVSEGNAAAIGLYRSLGFRQVGTRKGYYASQAGANGAVPSALVMELDLR